MRYGQINCECGQQFYFEANRNRIMCINCDKEYDISDYPVKEVEDESDIPDEDFSEESLEQLSE